MNLQGWNSITYDTRNELVFANRNKDYGAYVLRKEYNKRVSYIILGTIIFSFLLFGVKYYIDNKPKAEEKPIEMTNIVVDLTPPPPQEEQPPPPPPPPPPPMVEMVKFTPPVIKDDAVEEEPQKIQEEVKDVNVGTKDQEGEKDVVAPPTEVTNTGPTEPAQPEIFTIVEEQAEFPGGIQEMVKFIQKNLQYPPMAREAGLQGKCHLRFVVNETGEISNVEVMKGVPGCPDCDKEAVRVVKSMPKWKPGKMTGKAVKCYFNLPISFKLQ
jgi:protein TonB